jgi:hypothetical protein
LSGNANALVDYLGHSPEWQNLGAQPKAAMIRATQGYLVIGGLKAQAHGHVVIVVRSGASLYPVAYWAGRCTFNIGIIEQPLALTPGGNLYVATYSGSEREIALYDLKTCKTRWKSAVFAGKLELTSSALQMGEKTMKLDGQCLPRERATIAKP